MSDCLQNRGQAVIEKIMNRLEEGMIILLLLGMTLLTFVQVVARYVFNSGFVWALEVTTYMFAWLVLTGMSYGVKVGFHRVGDEADPDARPHRAAHADALAEYVREWMPGLDPASAVPVSCTYTSTDDGTFVLDRRGRLVVGAGFSGHGFKFAPGIGALLADLALDPSARAAEPFRLP